jgi:predicted RNA-binding protein YlxR (DUF448 family)
LRRMKTITSTRPTAKRLIAQRTCVACRQVRDKRELLRLVRTPQGGIEIDSTGKREGRGAYVCPTAICWEKALKGRQLEHALRGHLTHENREQLIKHGKEIFEGVS